MKIRQLVTLAVLASAPALVFAEQSGGVRYTGNELAIQMCKAVVEDDVTKLRMLLRSYRQTVTHGYMFSVDEPRGVLGDFTCNNLGLQQFSSQVGAQRVSAYLSDDTDAAQSQVAATAKYPTK